MLDKKELSLELMKYDLFGAEDIVAEEIINLFKKEMEELLPKIIRQVEAFSKANVNPCSQIEACIKAVFLQNYGVQVVNKE